MSELGVDDTWTQREIKSKAISKKEVDLMKKMAGSYEKLFSRRAMKYRQWGLHEKKLSESDYRDLITKEYTFLSRPVVILEDEIFVGNSKKVVAAAVERLSQ
jgi:arsenate reductase